MAHDGDTDVLESGNSDADIRWGDSVKTGAGSDKTNRTFYSSFFSEGEEYKMYDNVEIYDGQRSEPHIAKIMKLWEEHGSGKRVVLLRWFFRPKELPQLNLDASTKELFIAFGKGRGVTNENDLEVVCRKCKVLCTSRDPRNLKPSEEDLQSADHYFSKFYNVDGGHLSPVQGVADKLGCDAIYNKPEWVSNHTKAGGYSAEASVIDSLSMEAKSSETNKRPGDVKSVALEIKKQKVAPKQEGKQGSFKRPNSASDDTPKAKRIKGSVNEKVPTDAQSGQKIPKAVVLKGSLEKNEGEPKKNLEADIKEQQPKSPFKTDASPNINSLNSELAGIGALALSPVQGVSGQDIGAKQLLTADNKSSKTSENIMVTIPEKSNEKAFIAIPEKQMDNSMVGLDDVKTTEIMERENAVVPQSVGEHGKAEKKRLVRVSESGKPAAVAAVRKEEVDKGKASKPLKTTKPVEPLNLIKEEDRDAKRWKDDKGKGKLASSILAEKEGFQKEDSLDIDKKLKNRAVDVEKSKLGGSEVGKGGVSLNSIDKRRLFKKLPWEQNLQQSIPSGKVLLLQNFDSSVTSAEVHEMMKCVFEGISDVRVMPQNAFCPYGQALVIFEQRTAANNALNLLEEKCLVIDDKRPLIASRVMEQESMKVIKYPGHLPLDKMRTHKGLQTKEFMIAVSTSHCSQPNTIEYEMAMEWRHLHEITKTCYANLFEKQWKEITDLKKGAKRKINSRASD